MSIFARKLSKEGEKTMKTERNFLTVSKIQKQGASASGCPRFRVWLVDDQGTEYQATTATNSQPARFFSSGSVGRSYLLGYHYTPNGRMVLDTIESPAKVGAWRVAGWRERYAMRYGKPQRVGASLVKYILPKGDPVQSANGATYDELRRSWIN